MPSRLREKSFRFIRLKWTLVLAHPFEASLSVALIFASVTSLLISPSTSVIHRDLNESLAVAWTVGAALGGILTLAGVLSERSITVTSALERGGLFLMASTTLVYSIVLIYSGRFTSSLLLVCLFLSITAACLLRAHAITKANKQILEVLQASTRGRGE